MTTTVSRQSLLAYIEKEQIAFLFVNDSINYNRKSIRIID